MHYQKHQAKIVVRGKIRPDNYLELEFNRKTYPIKSLSLQVKKLLDQKNIEININSYFVVSPITKTKDKKLIPGTQAYQPYLALKVLSCIEENKLLQKQYLNKGIIVGIIIYENLNHNFFMVRVNRPNNSETIKVYGAFNDEDASTAVGKTMRLIVDIVDDRLVLSDYSCLLEEAEEDAQVREEKPKPI